MNWYASGPDAWHDCVFDRDACADQLQSEGGPMSTLRPLEGIEADHQTATEEIVGGIQSTASVQAMLRLLADIPALLAEVKRLREESSDWESVEAGTHGTLTATEQQLARVTAERDAFRAMTVRLREHLARWHGYSSPDYYGTGRLLADAERLLKEKA